MPELKAFFLDIEIFMPILSPSLGFNSILQNCIGKNAPQSSTILSSDRPSIVFLPTHKLNIYWYIALLVDIIKIKIIVSVSSDAR